MAGWGVRLESRDHVKEVSVVHGVVNGGHVGVLSVSYEGMMDGGHVRWMSVGYEGVVDEGNVRVVSVGYEGMVCGGLEVTNLGH